jgi:biotin carboxylase
MKKLMILGGNTAQVPLIQAAQKENYFVVLVDNTSANPGIAIADRHYQVNFMEKERVLEIARNEKIGGIISNSEAAMTVVAFVSEQMNLTGNSVESIRKICSKMEFRDLQKKAGVFFPAHVLSADFDEALKKSSSLKFPVIMKPCESSGSRGTTKIFSADELKKCRKNFDECSEFSRNKKVVLEEFVEMSSLDSVVDGDIFIWNGEIIWDGLFTSKRSEKSPMVPMTQTYPVVLSAEKIICVQKIISLLFAEAGVKFGEFNVELFEEMGGNFFCIEINARQGGNGIPSIIQKHCGIDMYKLLVTTAMGDTDYFRSVTENTRTYKFVARQLVFSRTDGILRGIFIDEKIKPFVTEIHQIKKTGEKVKNCHNATDIVAWVDFLFESRAQQLNFVKDIEKFVYPEIQEEEE